MASIHALNKAFLRHAKDPPTRYFPTLNNVGKRSGGKVKAGQGQAAGMAGASRSDFDAACFLHFPDYPINGRSTILLGLELTK